MNHLLLTCIGIGIIAYGMQAWASPQQPPREQAFTKVVVDYAKAGCKDKKHLNVCQKDAITYRPTLIMKTLGFNYDFKNWIVTVISLENPYVFQIPNSNIKLVATTHKKGKLPKLNIGDNVFITGNFNPTAAGIGAPNNGLYYSASIYNPMFRIMLSQAQSVE